MKTRKIAPYDLKESMLTYENRVGTIWHNICQ